MHLQKPMERKEHVRISVHLIPEVFMKEHNPHDKVHKGRLHVEIDKCIYDLPQAGRLANDLLRKRLAACGYIECTSTPGFWLHIHRHVVFTLEVDDFGVKFVGAEHLQHFVTSLKIL